MQKRALAIWPLAVKFRSNAAEVAVEVENPEFEQWNQELEKLQNEQRVVESAQERIDRLVPGLELKRIVL